MPNLDLSFIRMKKHHHTFSHTGYLNIHIKSYLLPRLLMYLLHLTSCTFSIEY